MMKGDLENPSLKSLIEMNREHVKLISGNMIKEKYSIICIIECVFDSLISASYRNSPSPKGRKRH